jgi:hypothetical protein
MKRAVLYLRVSTLDQTHIFYLIFYICSLSRTLLDKPPAPNIQHNTAKDAPPFSAQDCPSSPC